MPRKLPHLSQEQINLFWSNVNQRGSDDCWDWKLSKQKKGYGTVNLHKRSYLAHRVAFVLTKGHTKKLVCHSCDRPPCCNPRHLFAGTHQDNVDDRNQKGRTSHVSRNVGQDHPHTKLTNADARRIRRSKLTNKALAAKYGVSKACIWRIKTNRSFT